MATHIDRKALKDDAFRDSMFWALDWIYQRRRTFIAIGVAALLAGAGAVGYVTYRQSQSRTQTERFYAAERVGNDAELDETERQSRLRKAYAAFATEFPDGSLTPVAWMHVARLAWEQGDEAASRRAYLSALAHGQATADQRDMAHIGLAKLDESTGDLAAATAHYEAVSGPALEGLKAFNLGRLASAQHKDEEARQHFEKAARIAPNSVLADWARQNLDYRP